MTHGVVRDSAPWEFGVELTRKLVGSYCDQLGAAATETQGCDPVACSTYTRQFFLGNGGCWSIGYAVANDLRSKVPPGKVARAWHPHDIAGALSTSGFGSSFERLLDSDGLHEGDLVHLLSGSGRSTNLALAAELAAQRGASVLAHCGHDGGVLRRQVARGVQVSLFDQQIVEDVLLMRLWPARANDDLFIRGAVDCLIATLRSEVPNLAAVAAAVATAVITEIPIGVVAVDTAGVSASAEHIAHNLSWDMCWDWPELRPQVHFALSNGLLTAIANDSGVDVEPFVHLLRTARSQGIVINLGRNYPPGPTKIGGGQDLGILPIAFDLLRDSSKSVIATAEDADYLRAALVQIWGHVLVRLGRALICTSVSATDAARIASAQRPIAPRMGRDD